MCFDGSIRGSWRCLETLDFKFLLKPKYSTAPCVVEEGPSRLLNGGTLEEEDARPALFKVGDEEVLEYKVFIKVDIVSPFDLAASWRSYQENLQPSRVRGIPDISINVAPETGVEVLVCLNTFYSLQLLYKDAVICSNKKYLTNANTRTLRNLSSKLMMQGRMALFVWNLRFYNHNAGGKGLKISLPLGLG